MFTPIHPEPAWPDESQHRREIPKAEERRQEEAAPAQPASAAERKKVATGDPLASRHGGDTVGRERFDW